MLYKFTRANPKTNQGLALAKSGLKTEKNIKNTALTFLVLNGGLLGFDATSHAKPRTDQYIKFSFNFSI